MLAPGCAAAATMRCAAASVRTPKRGINSSATWTALGPAAVQTSSFGLVTGRVSTIAKPAADPGKFGHVLDNAETPELTGHIMWELYNDPDLMELSGRTLAGAQLAAKYGIADER